MDDRRSDRVLLRLVGAAAVCAVLGCATAVWFLGRGTAALRPGACRPAAGQGQLGRLLFEVPEVPGADEPWDFSGHLRKAAGDQAPGPSSTSNQSSDQPQVQPSERQTDS